MLKSKKQTQKTSAASAIASNRAQCISMKTNDDAGEIISPASFAAREKMRQLAAMAIDARMNGVDGDELIEVAAPVLREMREVWMTQFVEEICTAIREGR